MAKDSPLPIRRLLPRRRARRMERLATPLGQHLVHDHPGHQIQHQAPDVAHLVALPALEPFLQHRLERRVRVLGQDGAAGEEQDGLRMAELEDAVAGVAAAS